MKMIMLGESGVGKTTYLVSAYGCMKAGIIPMGKIWQRCALSLENNYFLDGLYNELIVNERYPLPTCKINFVDLSLRWKRKRIFGFELIDTVGGYINKKRDTDEYNELMEVVNGTNNIIAFFSAQDLSSKDEKTRTNCDRSISNLFTILEEAGRQERELNVTVVFTKTDQVSKKDCEDIKYDFRNIIDNDNTHINICHYFVSCSPKKQDKIELPICGIFLDELIKRIQYEDRFGKGLIGRTMDFNTKRMRSAAKNMCDHMYQSTQNQIWLNKKERI